ncbi:MAG: 23S rRNA (guanosine(2251)-2'-O)-methyltransferase RlmB [Thermodesulfobacteriota bacterium]
MKRRKGTAPDKPVLYGVHPVVETIRAGRRAIEKIYLAREIGGGSQLAEELEGIQFPVVHVDAGALSDLAGTLHHQGVAARVGPFPYVELTEIIERAARDSSVVLLLDQIQDPANLGAILRVGECLGAAGVVVAKDRSVHVTPAVEKAAAGASAILPVARVTNLVRAIEQIKEEGFWTYAADAHKGESCYSMDFSNRIAVVLGSEGKGLRRLVKERCDGTFRIPLRGRIDSLSVSQAATVILSEILRRRMACGSERGPAPSFSRQGTEAGKG